MMLGRETILTVVEFLALQGSGTSSGRIQSGQLNFRIAVAHPHVSLASISNSNAYGDVPK